MNNITIRYKHLIPCLDDLLDELHGSIAFSKIVRTKFTLYEWLVMLFDLTNNVPSTFMRLMNHVVRNLIGKYVVVYFDNILVFSTCLDDHKLHFKSLIELLRKESLYVNLQKCTFSINEIIFLHFIVGSHGIKVDEEKVKAIQIWPTPKFVSDVRSFHVLEIFYRCFDKDFSIIASLLNEIKGLFCCKSGTPLHILVKNLKVLCSSEGLTCLTTLLVTQANALSRRYALIAMLETKLLRLESLKELYLNDIDFGEAIALYVNLANGGECFL
ncbi:Retrovirus-related Pol polyprotein from transposon 17.6, partial [Mucuna pruriens]